jgi:hypothetical protein
LERLFYDQSQGGALLLTISSASPAGTASGPGEPPVIAWDSLLNRFTDLFTRPSTALFLHLVTGWVLCPGRRIPVRGFGRPDGPAVMRM